MNIDPSHLEDQLRISLGMKAGHLTGLLEPQRS